MKRVFTAQSGFCAPIAALVLFMVCGTARAQEVALPLAHASQLQAPAWIEHKGERSPLLPGRALAAGDRVSTGAGGRIHLRLDDHSVVKLGENTQLEITRLGTQIDRGTQDSLLMGSLRLNRGTLRYTLLPSGKTRRRELDLRVGSLLTVGIRGTDLFSRASATESQVLLVEGLIEAAVPGHRVQLMDQPVSLYHVPRDRAPELTAPVPPIQIAKLTRDTELAGTPPAKPASSGYQVGLESFPHLTEAEDALRRYVERGHTAQITRTQLKGAEWYRVVTGNFASEAEARRYCARIKRELNVATPWVIKP